MWMEVLSFKLLIVGVHSKQSPTQSQIQHDLLLRHTLPPQQTVHGTDEPRDRMPRELHQPHQRPYAAPRRLLAGAHAEPLGQPQVDR